MTNIFTEADTFRVLKRLSLDEMQRRIKAMRDKLNDDDDYGRLRFGIDEDAVVEAADEVFKNSGWTIDSYVKAMPELDSDGVPNHPYDPCFN